MLAQVKPSIKSPEQYYTNHYSYTGSIGLTGKIGPASNGRLKGFLDITVDTPKMVGLLVGIALHGRDLILNPAQHGYYEDTSRLLIRAVVTNEMMEQLHAKMMGTGFKVEALIPINHNGHAASIVYLAYNTEERRLTSEERGAFNALWRRIYDQRITREELHDCVRRAESKYSFFVMSSEYAQAVAFHREKHFDDMISQVYSLMNKNFGFSRNEVSEALLANTSILVTVKYTNEVAAACVVERAEIAMTHGEPIRIAELTDAAVVNGHNNNGLHLAMTTRLLAAVADQNNHATFSEATFSQETVLKSSAAQGRVFCGILEHHTRIDGNLRNFSVMHIPQHEMQQFRDVLR